MKDLRTLCDEAIQLWDADCDMDSVINEMRAALAQPEPEGPTDEELLELMPESMRDEFYVARICSDAAGRRVKPGIFRVALNTCALEYARAVYDRAVFDRWGQDQQNTEQEDY